MPTLLNITTYPFFYNLFLNFYLTDYSKVRVRRTISWLGETSLTGIILIKNLKNEIPLMCSPVLRRNGLSFFLSERQSLHFLT